MSHQLESRVANLEKSLKIYRISIFTIIIVVAGFVLMSFHNKKNPVADLVQAKAFQVVDDRGKVLVEINQEDGNGQLSTFTPAGKRLVSFFTTDDGAGGLNTFSKEGKVLFKVTNNTEGGGYMTLFNSEGNEVTEFGTTNIESGYIRVNDRKGNRMAWLTYTEEGGGYFSLAKDGTEMIRLSTPAVGGRMGIYNEAKTRIGFIGAQDNKDGNISIWDATGTRTVGLPF